MTFVHVRRKIDTVYIYKKRFLQVIGKALETHQRNLQLRTTSMEKAELRKCRFLIESVNYLEEKNFFYQKTNSRYNNQSYTS